MVAAVYHAHGWKTGGLTTQSRDYVTYENQTIVQHLIRVYGKRKKGPVEPLVEPDQRLIDVVKHCFGNNPWCWKGDVFYAEAFLGTFPDLALVYVRRNVEDAVNSGLDHRQFPLRSGKTREQAQVELRDFIVAKYAYMHELELKHGGSWIYTDDVLAGNMLWFREAFDEHGFGFDENIARSVITGLQ